MTLRGAMQGFRSLGCTRSPVLVGTEPPLQDLEAHGASLFVVLRPPPSTLLSPWYPVAVLAHSSVSEGSGSTRTAEVHLLPAALLLPSASHPSAG